MWNCCEVEEEATWGDDCTWKVGGEERLYFGNDSSVSENGRENIRGGVDDRGGRLIWEGMVVWFWLD